MLIDFLALSLGLVVLVYAADWFVDGASAIARNFGVSPLLIGLTIVGLGTSAPEIMVSFLASFQGNAGLAVGNAIGSNIANMGLILGATALISPLAFHSGLLKRELPVLMLISTACYVLAIDGLSVVDGVLMLLGLVAFLYWLIRTAMTERKNDILAQEVEAEVPETMSNNKAWLFFWLGLIGLLISSKVLVWAAVNIAQAMGVSDLVIGLTIVALGTSLPELAASIGSVLKGEDDLAVGNVIGSNVYNLLAVFSLPALIAPGPIDAMVISRDFSVLLAFTAVLFIFGVGLSKAGNINRWEGGGLLAAYLFYQWTIYQSVV
ncbi:cation:H+ antiporter [Bathymodiolus japonicus methanotrophic gill symbiont]|uniref:calcium/sodium antiporter n=1 Tax=Bathymodiolus japonicus methanotrophic gill symbiont TaxID=113269 RepID=UPI001B671F1B|nr:calcium/sodium antiporter [Bathymodiolus japonicus methanotrophic gill symbiont]GFO71606.1 cation:H+ antiporter [Bathymodiolus japonicus methanotrophic gill symbiont]